ncbi:uncharacterized protein LOC108828949 [Raphanus sativus]|uniref:Uncharacterized protein LOC108828949 n=1 Tax=Raphanus sativus TaxID=3726 RepID=A0A9W3C7H1_RAPSA|nr:uncharacterized protein LOC108828949 [Raphanus sativus]
MVYDLGKRVEIIQNVLGVKVTDGSPSDDNEDHQNAANSDYAKSSPSYDNEEEANSRVKICATDDENGEEICDEVEISDTHQLTQVNTLGENENTEKITSDEETEKMEEESCSKQKSKVTSSTPTFTTPNFETRESRHSGKGANEVNDDVEPPLKKKKKADIGNVELRRSERGQIPSIHTQPPFTGARKKHPIHIEAGLQVLKLRNRNNPDLFLNKTALVVGVKFLEEIDELYVEFLDDKEGFQFASGFDKYNIEKNITFLYSAIAVEEYYWLGIVVNLEKRSITAFNSAAVKFTEANVGAYLNAYATVLPFMLRNVFRDVTMDASKFSIKIVSDGLPQVVKIEDSGIYALKLIECHAMRIVDFTKLTEEKVVYIREKLAVDIFSELQ